jgi:hypothetical protein
MPTHLENELIRIAQAFRLHSATSFSFAGGPIINAEERVHYYSRWQESGDEDPLLVVLRRVIYYQCYARPFQGSVAGSDAEASVADESDAAFVAALSRANQSRFRWDPFWEIYRISHDGEIQVRKGDTHRLAVPGEYSFDAGPGIRPVEGNLVSLQMLPHSLTCQPHFYFCFGEELNDRFDAFHLVRFYFNIEHSDAAALIEALTGELNRFQVPFEFKCPTSPSSYDRVDTAVLYIAPRWLQITSRIVAEISANVLPHLQPIVPLFCRMVWPGIGFAEDPGNGFSFGETRCGLIALGMCRAWKKSSEPSAQDFLESIKEEFAASGISLIQPWLNPGSIDVADFTKAADLLEDVEIQL